MKKVMGTTFEAMNTTVNVQIITNVDWVEMLRDFLKSLPAWFAKMESVLSRFDPQSELSLINKGVAGTYKISNMLAEVVNLALNAAKVTNGIFDPTILRELEQAGYDCSFEEVTDRTEELPIPFVKDKVIKFGDNPRIIERHEGYKLIKRDPSLGSLVKSNGVGLDLGGIAKGWAVDKVFEHLRHLSEQAEVCVNAGGDLRILKPSGGRPWLIQVESPFDKSNSLLSLKLIKGAVATSNVLKRRWKQKGQWQHHLIDPRTGSPSQSTVVAATVLADTTVEAEIWAKVLCILGIDRGFELLHKQTNLGALVLSANGELIINEKMRRFIDVRISKPTFSVRL